MSKICGYSCEHNKSGVCQISGCDKKSIMSDKTEVQTFTRYIDPTITKLQQENKQLKEKLDKYENPEDMTLMMMWCTEKVKDENKKLKKQLQENTETLLGRILELRGQQKEFIKYLEDGIHNIEPLGVRINYDCEYDSEEDYINAMKEQSRLNTLKEILQKYKSIIGDSK